MNMLKALLAWRRELRENRYPPETEPEESPLCGAPLPSATIGRSGVACERLRGHEQYSPWHMVARPDVQATWVNYPGGGCHIEGLVLR